jgi:N-acetylmuramoyl-L-alanine amidase
VAVLAPNQPRVVSIDDDPGRTGTTDSILPGRPLPYGTYHWFFPTGTLAAVSGRWNDQLRLQLSSTSVAWVDLGGARPLPEGTPPPAGRVGSLRVFRSPTSATLRIPVGARVPFRVEEEERRLTVTLYGVQGDIDWIHYGERDPLIRLVRFVQRTADELDITVELGEPVWGYRARWAEGQLLLEIRRPPEIDRRRPLAGRKIALDPGHPPLGATGPTGVTEPEVTLAVARIARDLLVREGAEVVLLRDSEAPVGLEARTTMAERQDAELLVSIHANALPDGVNPFLNNGTTVYYFHPRAAELARAIGRELVARFGFRDLGVGRGDLALARPTWMPAVLVEGLFLMIPEQEAVLASREGQRRYAEGIVEGLKAFLRARSEGRR